MRPARPAAAPSFTTLDKLAPALCVLCREREAGFMGGPCDVCAKALVRSGGSQA